MLGFMDMQGMFINILRFVVLHVDHGSKTGIYLSLFRWACSIKAMPTYISMVCEKCLFVMRFIQYFWKARIKGNVIHVH